MMVKTRDHLLICLEEKNYSRKVLLRGALLAKTYGSTFEVVFFYKIESNYTMFHLLNIAESKRLSKRLGAKKFAIKRMKNEKNATREIVEIAKNNNVTEIIMSGAQSKNNSKRTLWSRFSRDKYNYIIKSIPNIVLTLINHKEDNPFEKEIYENGREGYLVKKNDKKASYFLSDKRYREKDVPGIFFRKRDADKRNGIFTFVRNGEVNYVHIHHGKTRCIKSLNML